MGKKKMGRSNSVLIIKNRQIWPNPQTTVVFARATEPNKMRREAGVKPLSVLLFLRTDITKKLKNNSGFPKRPSKETVLRMIFR